MPLSSLFQPLLPCAALSESQREGDVGRRHPGKVLQQRENEEEGEEMLLTATQKGCRRCLLILPAAKSYDQISLNASNYRQISEAKQVTSLAGT
ncbi:unnamed protein product [Lampetra planeri]